MKKEESWVGSKAQSMDTCMENGRCTVHLEVLRELATYNIYNIMCTYISVVVRRKEFGISTKLAVRRGTIEDDEEGWFCFGVSVMDGGGGWRWQGRRGSTK